MQHVAFLSWEPGCSRAVVGSSFKAVYLVIFKPGKELWLWRGRWAVHRECHRVALPWMPSFVQAATTDVVA